MKVSYLFALSLHLNLTELESFDAALDLKGTVGVVQGGFPAAAALQLHRIRLLSSDDDFRESELRIRLSCNIQS